ncbi:MAG: DUF2514 family protein [Pseudomonadota bacterium]|nr:DUF2514 family protein [Pseudomonadota bacterium]
MSWLPLVLGFARRHWRWLAAAAATGLLMVLYTAHLKLHYQKGYAAGQLALRAEMDARIIEAQQQVLALERATTQREQALQALIDQREQEARNAQAEYEKRVADADANTERMRGRLDRITRAYARDCQQANAAAAAAGARPPAGCAIGLLAKLLGETQREAARYAKAADEARRAGMMCERAYDGARKALQDATP